MGLLYLYGLLRSIVIRLFISSQYNKQKDALFKNGSNLCRNTQYSEMRRGFTQRPQENVY
jgi:hypothetical protein